MTEPISDRDQLSPTQLADFIDSMAENPKGGKMAAIAYKHAARLIRERLAALETCPQYRTVISENAKLRRLLALVTANASAIDHELAMAEARAAIGPPGWEWKYIEPLLPLAAQRLEARGEISEASVRAMQSRLAEMGYAFSFNEARAAIEAATSGKEE